MRYAEYMSSDAWKRKRLERLAVDQHRCRLCDACEDLEVHHRPGSYVRIPDESVQDDLITVCRICHEFVTDRIRRARLHSRSLPDLKPLNDDRCALASSHTPSVPRVASIHLLNNERLKFDGLEIPEVNDCRQPSPVDA